MPTYTYDLSTNVGKSRLHAADTDVSDSGANATHSDEEYTYFLTRVGSVPELAAAMALRSAAADAAKVAVITKRGRYGNDETRIPQLLLETADRLERTVPWASSDLPTDYPKAVFTTDSADGTTGTMDGW